jgi:peptidyl-prolyl cis-trans isomerase C
VLDPEILKVAFRQGFDRDPAVLAEVAEDREGMALDAYFAQEIEGKVVMDEKAIRALWAKDPVHYHDRAFIESRIIVVERQSLADSILARLKSGASFDQLARDFSIDAQSGPEGGKAGVQYRGSQRNVGLEDAMFATPAGQIGGPESTPEGWVLWKIEVNEPEVKRTFEEARAMVERDYRTMESERLLKAKLADLRSRAKVRLFPERIDAALLAAPEGMWPD